MKKNLKTLIKKINNRLIRSKEKIDRQIHLLKGGNSEQESLEDPSLGGSNKSIDKDAEEAKKLEEMKAKDEASDKKVEDLINKKIQSEATKAALIEQVFLGIDKIIEDPAAAQEQMNAMLAASMNLDVNKIKDSAALVYEVLQKVDTKELMANAKSVADSASELTKELQLGTSGDSSGASEALDVAKQLISPVGDALKGVAPDIKSAADAVKGAVGEAKAAVQSVDVKAAAETAKAALGDVKNAASELIKTIPPDQMQAAVSTATAAAGAVKNLATTLSNNIDVKQITDTLATVAGALEPLLEIGASIPGLGICLSVVSKLAVAYREQKELNTLLEDMRDSIQNSLFLIKLIKTTITIYKDDAAAYYSAQSKILSDNIAKAKGDGAKNLKASLKILFNEAAYLQKIQLKPNIETKVTAKVQNIIDVLTKFIGEMPAAPTDEKKGFLSRQFDTLKRTAKKAFSFMANFGMAKFYKAEILKNLNVVNNLLIIYNSQFDWAQGSFIMRLKGKSIGDQKLLDKIWMKIEGTEDFKNYLWNDDVPAPAAKTGGMRRVTYKSRVTGHKITRRKRRNHHKRK
jgi:hypothetical protein